MNWEALGALAEMVGAVGVILSLLYLTGQVRQNTKLARAQTRQALADGAQALASDFLDADGMARVMWRHLEGEEFEGEELLRLTARAYRDFRFMENAHYQYSQGLLTTEEWEGFRVNLQVLLEIPVYKDYWESQAPIFSPTFRNEMASLAEKSPLDLISKQVKLPPKPGD